MKKFLLIFALLFGFVLQNTFAENYNDIVVYQLPSYAESQAKNFVSSITSNGAFYTKQGMKIYIVVLSKGYGLDYQEYKLYSLENKEVITPSSSKYYNLKRLFD
jgi:Fe2+ transport system protein B